jgi:hypothetical protein
MASHRPLALPAGGHIAEPGKEATLPTAAAPEDSMAAWRWTVRITLWLVVVASLLHIGEEYRWPGGFLGFMQRAAPSLTVGVATPALAVVINGLMVVGLVVAALIGPAVPSVALSGAALVAVNGMGHLAAAVHIRGYAPGVVTGGLVYLPVAVAAYTAFGVAGRLTVGVVVVSLLLGVACNLVPLAWFGLHRLLAGPTQQDATPAAGH